MTTQEQYIARLKEYVEAKFGRTISTIEDCEALGEAVGEVTNIRLDSRAYMPIFTGNAAPRPVTLSTLARYLGYGSWSDFCTSSDVKPAEDKDIIPTTRRWGVIILTIIAIMVVVAAIILLIIGSKTKEANNEEMLQPVVESIEQQWMARTQEECNTIRAYIAEENYRETIDCFVTGYEELLKSDIAKELEAAAKSKGITIEQHKITTYSDSISSRCRAMYEVLYLEIDSQR